MESLTTQTGQLCDRKLRWRDSEHFAEPHPTQNKGEIIMGNNGAFTIMEATVVGAYRLGRLDKSLLEILLEPYRDSDIDSGGKEGLTGKDGLEVEEIIVKIMGGKLPVKPKPAKSYDDWTPDHDQYANQLGAAFKRATKKFNWC
jgi:hypothetical protein